MNIRTIAASATAIAFAVSFGVANAQTALTVSCAGTASTSSIAWSASASGGTGPYAFLWSNGSTSTTQTTSNTPGTFSMNIQATDASSSVATSTCSATVAQPEAAPIISSFTATPTTITAGQSATLSWNVSNASSTSLDNGIGLVGLTSVTVSPTVNTTYTLTAMNPGGTTIAHTTVIVNATTTATSTSGSVASQIQALLQQIAQLQQQIRNLLSGQNGTTTPPTPPTPPGQIGKQFCINFNRNLGEGSHGDDVRQLQTFLISIPGLGFSGTATGFFGPLTMNAVMRFQQQNSISGSGTGFVGSLTRGFFERDCGKGLGKGDDDSNMTSTSSASTTNGVFIPANHNSGHDGDNDGGNDNGNDHGNGNGHGHGRDY